MSPSTEISSVRRVLVVGGVAAGASCAARLRRQDESCDILLYDRGPFVSFANCGLPYYVGNVIENEAKLLVATPELFRERFRIEVKTEHEVLSIDRQRQEITVRHDGVTRTERYDVLVLATGARGAAPPLPGLDRPGVFSVRTIPDSRRIRQWMDERGARRAAIIGGGFVGLEMAENLLQRGLKVALIEAERQVMPSMDVEMVSGLHERLRERGVELHLADPLAAIEGPEPVANGGGGAAPASLRLRTRSGVVIEADLAVVALGVRPETTLAREAGLELGRTGGIRVDAYQRTSDPAIFAVGDAVEVSDGVTRQAALVPLAGPANRQGRLAADAIAGRPRPFRGVQGTAVVGMLGLTAASTGATEKSLQRAGLSSYARVYLHPGHHVGYYPGARPIHLKLLFDRTSGRVLGAQAVGEEGVEKRIDVIATFIQMGATVFDLEEAELCYAPQFGAAKDPVNVAGMIAANQLRGDIQPAGWEELDRRGEALLLDVRSAQEHARDGLPDAVNIPLNELRRRMAELSAEREIWVYCGVGQRSYFAARALAQHGFRVRNLSGGLATYRMVSAVA